MGYFSYAEMLVAREECFKRFGSIFSIPVHSGNKHNILLNYLSRESQGNMLDFGAGPQRLKPFISAHFPSLAYRSLDSDAAYGCDYTSVEEIPENTLFSLVCADQVLEHIPVEGTLGIFDNLKKKLAPGCLFYATVPNISHPTRFFSNIEHCTYVSYFDLYYFCRFAGLEPLAIFRYSKRHPKGWFERFIAKKIQDIYRMDWADSIAIIARKQL